MTVELSELEKRVLDTAEVKRLAEKARKVPIRGSLKGITHTDFERLKETAAVVDEMRKQVTAARAEAKKASDTLKNEQKQIDEYAERLNNDRERLEVEKTQTPTSLLLKRNKELSEKNKQLERVIRGQGY